MNFGSVLLIHERFSVRSSVMLSLSATEARASLYSLMDQAAASHEPIQITGKRTNAILMSEEDWCAIQETLFLLSIPGMRDSIRAGMETPVGRCGTRLPW